MNSFIEETLGLKLPLENQNDPNPNRLEKGELAQVAIFGEEMRGYATSGDPKTVHIRKWLTDNCFGDYYTRSGLDYKQKRNDYFLFLICTRWMQATSHCPCQSEYKIRK